MVTAYWSDEAYRWLGQ